MKLIDETSFNSHYEKLNNLNNITKDNIKSLLHEIISMCHMEITDDVEYAQLFKLVQRILNSINKDDLLILNARSSESFGSDVILLHSLHTKDFNIQLIESYIKDYLIINSVLKNTELCMSLLKNLESNLQTWVDSEEYKNYQPELKKRKEIPNRLGPIKSNDRFFLAPKIDQHHSEKFKILTSYFQYWSIQNEYKFAKVKGLELDEIPFFKLIEEGRLLDDKAVSKAHGRCAHAIQQFIVSEYYKGNFTPKLSHKPIELYAKLGNPSQRAKTGLWDDLYDIQPNIRPKNDFRCPERIMECINNNNEQYPLLAECIKREAERKNNYGENQITRLEAENIRSLFKKN